MSQPVRADQIQPENIKFLWRDRIPEGMFSMIAGRPDQGKSMIATVIAAELTKQGKNVLYSSKERKPSVIEKPRFVAAGGVEERMFYWRFSLPKMMDDLVAYILENDIALVVMDPVSAHFIGVNTSGDRIREVTNPLTEVAEETGCAFLFIEHALKRVAAYADPLTAIKGASSGIPATCAMAFLFGTDPRNEDHKILACVKHNITDKRKALQFEIDTVEVKGVDDEVPTLVYDDEVNFDPMRLLARTAEDGGGKLGRPSDKRTAAAEWLTNYLAAAGGPVLSSKIQEDAKHYNMPSRTLRRAAADMGVVKVGNGSAMTWDLPDHIKELISESDDDPQPAEILDDEEAATCATDVDVIEAEIVDDETTIDDDELADFLKGLSND